jgi:hypothetical protein
MANKIAKSLPQGLLWGTSKEKIRGVERGLNLDPGMPPNIIHYCGFPSKGHPPAGVRMRVVG